MFLKGIVYLAVATSAATLPPGEGKALVQRTCIGCHALKVVTSKRASEHQWSMLVDQMVSRGADLDDDEVGTVVDYLVKNFGLNAPPAVPAKSPHRAGAVNVNQATAAELAAALGLSAKESSAIVAYRKQNGNFKAWRDLTKVPGVQAGQIESKKDRLVF